MSKYGENLRLLWNIITCAAFLLEELIGCFGEARDTELSRRRCGDRVLNFDVENPTGL